MTDPVQTAMALYQAYLDAGSDAFWSGDDRTLAQTWVYPHVIRARHLTQVIEGPDDLLTVADIARQSMRRLGGTAFHCVCTRAAFTDDTRSKIKGAHRVYLLNGGTYAHPPYESRLTLLHADGQWRGAKLSSDNDIAKLTTLDPDRSVRIQ